MRLLITGGAGFIGSNLAKLALDNDVEVTILDDLSAGYRENIQDLDLRGGRRSRRRRDAATALSIRPELVVDFEQAPA